jgi:hypothetical protein
VSGGDRPVTETIQEHFAGVSDRCERRYKKQRGKDGIDNHFGLAQKSPKWMRSFSSAIWVTRKIALALYSLQAEYNRLPERPAQ